MNRRVFFATVLFFLSCSCHNRNATVNGYVVLNNNIAYDPLPLNASTPVSVDDSQNSSILEKPQLLIRPRMLSVAESDKPAAATLSEPISTSENSLNKQEVLPVVTSIDTTASQPNKTEESTVDENLSNNKCNTSACPKYKCVTHLIPANLTAGECCDHCAPSTGPASIQSTAEPTSKPVSSDSSDERSSSQEQQDERPSGCNICPFAAKSDQDSPSQRGCDDNSNQSQDD